MEILQLNEDGEIVELNPESFNNNPDIVPILPIDVNGRRRVWRWSDRLKILTAARNGDFKVQADGRGYYVQLKDRIKSGRKPKTIWDDSRYDASSSGTILLKKMFDGEKPFSYPKSIYTMIDTLKIITNDDDIILDFFGGSGTTAHAVLELNKLDGGNRRFIIVEQMNYFDTVTVPRVRKVYEQLISEKAEVNPLLVMELKKLNGFYLDKINESDDSSLELLFNDIIKNPFIISKPNSSDVSIKDDFTKMSFSDQRKLLVEILDKNMLYVNYSDIDDEEMKVSSVEKKIYTQLLWGKVNMSQYLFEKINSAIEVLGEAKTVPNYILNGISSNIKLRDYQKQALINYLTFAESGLSKNKQKWALFHMATGSGKTVIMASLILYYFEKGYRNFLFFVRNINIIDKTIENLTNTLSNKYLFNSPLEINGIIVNIKKVDNFQHSHPDSINICFTSNAVFRIHCLYYHKKIHFQLMTLKITKWF